MHKYIFVIVLATSLLVGCNNQDKNASTAAEATTTEAKAAHPAKITKASKTEATTLQSPNITSKKAANSMNWLSIDDAATLKNSEGKMYFVDVYTDWCGWCKVMDKKTFSDPEVQKYLEDNFHVVKFNAEQKEPINWEGKTYEWVAAGRKGVNTLAQELLGGRLGYPTMVYLDENRKVIKSSPGFKDPQKLLAELKQL